MSKVYVVMGGMYYEGCEPDTTRVFLSRQDAEVYGQWLVSEKEDWQETRWDRYEIVESLVA